MTPCPEQLAESPVDEMEVQGREGEGRRGRGAGGAGQREDQVWGCYF